MAFVIIFVVFLLISFLVQNRLKSKFREYSQETLVSGLTGAQVAQKMLEDHRIYDVEIVSVEGKLSDHYNPGTKTIALSEEVFHGASAAAAAVAAHETGHAVQHAQAYSMLEIRSMLVPVQNASSTILNTIFILSFFGGIVFNLFSYQTVLAIIVASYAVITLFSFITLPVEFDASKRALAWIEDHKIVTTSEQAMAKDALHWAAMTYVVGALASLTFLLYYVFQMVASD
ncbi:zinc metallopeptidase [uncultured Microscilla sp.]|uniref:zinc metallopeptidase n=1 Tax=uncultured Microscilla sp. TaxID=432653 RepID=UPI00261F9F9E|nr:zinc metallopeptidase [uncultured Microscilla sp.]